MSGLTSYKTMRWFGPQDEVSLRDIAQSGCEGVVTALHHIPVGEEWSVDEISKRVELIERDGLEWKVVESLPVHEDIKKRSGNYKSYIDNYRQSLRNLSGAGIEVVTYNFMPVFDWVRTKLDYKMEDGSKTLLFDKLLYIAFDVNVLKRPGAEKDYSPNELKQAKKVFQALDLEEKEILYSVILQGLPGANEAFTIPQVLKAIKSYEEIDDMKLKQNLKNFLKDILPTAEKNNIRMAIHPDDPPFPVFGLPRIVSTQKDLREIFTSAVSGSNGLCFCTGSLGARADNDLLSIMNEFPARLHFLHLRNTKLVDQWGSFRESGQLTGDADMYAIVKKSLEIMKNENRRIPMRPDHGTKISLDEQIHAHAGYPIVGRIKGLAELRGLERGILYSNVD